MGNCLFLVAKFYKFWTNIYTRIPGELMTHMSNIINILLNELFSQVISQKGYQSSDHFRALFAQIVPLNGYLILENTTS